MMSNGLSAGQGARLGMSFRCVWDEYIADEKLPSVILATGKEGRTEFLKKVVMVYKAACDAEHLLVVTREETP